MIVYGSWFILPNQTRRMELFSKDTDDNGSIVR